MTASGFAGKRPRAERHSSLVERLLMSCRVEWAQRSRTTEKPGLSTGLLDSDRHFAVAIQALGRAYQTGIRAFVTPPVGAKTTFSLGVMKAWMKPATERAAIRAARPKMMLAARPAFSPMALKP